MVLLSPEIPTNTVRWKEHMRGRLLETRFDWHGARTTVLAVYQHVWSPAKTVQANKQDRAAVLKSLSRSVRRVPARDTLVIAGDFNSSVSSTPRLVGPRTLTPQEARPDEAELTNFVRTHHLAVLNTWQVSSPHTFVQGDSRTQIDFLLTKASSSGGSAKQAAPLVNFPLGSWKTGGHLPLFAKIKPVRHWQLPGPRVKPLKHDSEALQQAVRQGLPILTDMQKWVRDHVHQGMTPPEWDALLSKATQRFFPKLPAPPKADSADTILARRMWRARRSSEHNSTAEDPDMAALILQHQKAVRQAKKTKADEFLAEVDAAINAGDPFVAYKVLKKLRPWQPSQKAQLKDSKGYLLSPTGELQELRKYATDVFGKYPRLQDNLVELPMLAATTLAKHIASIKPGWGLSDAQSRVVQHLREVRQIGRSAFDTVSRQDILDQLQALSVEPGLVSLVHGLHHSSKYRLHAQGGYTEVETTTGRLLHMLIGTFGLEAVQQHLTGYADDISVHKTIRSRRDLQLAHDLIQALLAAVGRLRLRVNPTKCSVMVRLSGTEAPSVMRRHTCWLPDASGELKKHWRIGTNKAYPAFRLEGQIKYLGIIISYSNYELLTLRHRLAEAGKKIQQVRKYIYNRRIASPAARLRVWFATVWATAVTGLPEVGLSPESARLLRGWYAHKLRSVLNQPAHITHVTTADLLRLHKLQDPVDKIIRRMKGRIAKLRKRSRSVTEAAADVALHSHILIDLDRILQEAQSGPSGGRSGHPGTSLWLPYLPGSL
ncbi:Trpt1 [Symbiodinium sp. KB8]|nr:Trpt1 [Symbiodinium sp. KB8]